MDTKNLEMIIEAMQSAGDGAFWLIVFYLSTSLIKTIVVTGALFAIISKVTKMVYKSCSLRGKLESIVGRLGDGCESRQSRLLEVVARESKNVR